MAILKIVPNIAVSSTHDLRAFYVDLFDLDVAMDMGWIVTLATGETAPVQLSIATQGGSDTPVPDMSIEVDDVDTVYARALELGHPITYALTDEPWGVRRFYVKDPAGKVLNVLSHLP